MAFLLWPAVWNGYPIVFADTGTYLSQAMHHYLGWDRPVFYSLFIFPLHLGQATWPVVLVQSALAAYCLDLTRRAFGLPIWTLPGLTGFLSITTWFPWIVSELMPDLFTPLLVLLLSTLLFAPARFGQRERLVMTGLTMFMISTQQSSLPLSVGLLVIAFPLRSLLNRPPRGPLTLAARENVLAPGFAPGFAPGLAPCLAPCFAAAALIAVNAAGHGRFAVSPHGNVFLLARIIYDGPGMLVLRRDCPREHWRLCHYLSQFPPSADEFLWNVDSPIRLAGGHKAVSAEAGAIIWAALRAEPGRAVHAALSNTVAQLGRFASGDGLQPWAPQVGSLINREFPEAERIRFQAARQQQGILSVPESLATAHHITALIGISAAMILVPIIWRRNPTAAGFLAVSLLLLPLGAAITGALSGPHDRYESRIIWLPAFTAVLTLATMARVRFKEPV